jgi:hypothetical protein
MSRTSSDPVRDAAVLEQVPLRAPNPALDRNRLLVRPRAGPQGPPRGSPEVTLVLGHPGLEQLALPALLGHRVPLNSRQTFVGRHTALP